MPLRRCGFAILILISVLCPATTAQAETNFATDDEIKLLLTQTKRAVEQYKPLLDQEELLFGEKGRTTCTDREVIRALETAITAFQKNPQAFNGPIGFSFFEWIDDADRNSLLCASGAANAAVTLTLEGKTDKARGAAQLSQSCLDTSSLLYTVSENAGALYTRYVDGGPTCEIRAQRGAKVHRHSQEAWHYARQIVL